MEVDQSYKRRDNGKTDTSERPSKRQREDNSQSNFILSFKLFMEAQDDDISENLAVERYNLYKDATNKKYIKQFFASHKEENWLKDLYHPVNKDQVAEKAKNNILQRTNLFKWLWENDLIKISLDSENANKIYLWLRTVSAILSNSLQESITKEKFTQLLNSTEELCEIEPVCIFVTNFPSTASEEDVEKIFSEFEGHEKTFLRPPRVIDDWKSNAFVRFLPQTNIYKVVSKINRTHSGLRVFQSKPSQESIVAFEGPVWEKKVILADITHAVKHVKKFTKDTTDLFVETVVGFGEGLDDLEIDELIKRLDLLLIYLRLVYSYDYYGRVEYDESKMGHPLAMIHVRNADGKEEVFSSDKIDEWIARFDLVESVITEKEAEKLGKLNKNDEINKFYADHCQRIDENRFLCTLSNKLFMTENFVNKHIERKYGHKILELVDEVEYFNNFVLDPKKPLPPLTVKHSSFMGEGSPQRRHRERPYKSRPKDEYPPVRSGGRRHDYIDYDVPESYNL